MRKHTSQTFEAYVWSADQSNLACQSLSIRCLNQDLLAYVLLCGSRVWTLRCSTADLHQLVLGMIPFMSHLIIRPAQVDYCRRLCHAVKALNISLQGLHNCVFASGSKRWRWIWREVGKRRVVASSRIHNALWTVGQDLQNGSDASRTWPNKTVSINHGSQQRPATFARSPARGRVQMYVHCCCTVYVQQQLWEVHQNLWVWCGWVRSEPACDSSSFILYLPVDQIQFLYQHVATARTCTSRLCACLSFSLLK